MYGVDRDQEENYNILSANYSLLDFWKLPLFDADTRLVYRAEAQYAGINLSGIMRFSLTGPTRARAYAPGFFTADDAYFLEGEIYEQQLKNKEKAMEIYRTFLDKYPGGVYAAEARKRYRTLRGDFQAEKIAN